MGQCWNCRFWDDNARTISREDQRLESICGNKFSLKAGKYATEEDGCDHWQQDMSQYEPPLIDPPLGV